MMIGDGNDMNRIIKFRAWDTYAQVMCEDVTHSYGLSPLNDILLNDIRRKEELVPINFYSICYDDRYEVMQFTGLKDRNGKEIYEGDILATENYDIDYDYWTKEDYGYTIVQYKDLGFSFSNWTIELFPSESVYSIEFVKVIGNIFENPKLIEE
jgi:uncharacterized phage protein (TIGR01671 family)